MSLVKKPTTGMKDITPKEMAIRDYVLEEIRKTYEVWNKYIDFRKQNDVYIMLDKYLVRFGEIDSTAQKRVKKIASIIPKLSEYKNIKYIDLRWEESSYLRLEGDKENQKPINIGDEKKPNNINAPTYEDETREVPVEEDNAEDLNHQAFD